MKIEEVIKATVKMKISTKTLINVMYTSRYIEEMITSLLKQYGLTNQQFNVLRILRGQKGKPANLSTLQERMIDKNSNTTRLVDKLVAKELVERQTCEQNRRKIEIFITDRGLKQLKELDPVLENMNKEILANFICQPNGRIK
jgi:transcriptional regulator, MarR family